MKILYRFLSVFSLLLCVATAILWARTYWWTDYLDFAAGRTGNGLYTGPGMLYAHSQPAPDAGVLVGNFVFRFQRADPGINETLNSATTNLYGFHYGHAVGIRHAAWSAVPVWWLVILFVAYPIAYRLYKPRKRTQRTR